MKNIVVAIDVGKPMAELVATAEELARAFHAKLWITHIGAPDPAFVGLVAGPQSVRDDRALELADERRVLGAIVARLRKDGFSAEGRLHIGETVATLLNVCRDVDADLIIVAKHNRGRLAHAMLGSVCESLVRHSVCRVMVLPAHGSDAVLRKGT